MQARKVEPSEIERSTPIPRGERLMAFVRGQVTAKPVLRNRVEGFSVLGHIEVADPSPKQIGLVHVGEATSIRIETGDSRTHKRLRAQDLFACGSGYVHL